MKVKHVRVVRECSCEAYPFCEHSSAVLTQTHAGLCFIIRRGLTRAYNAVLGSDQEQEHPTTKNTLDELEKSIDALDKLERAYNAAGLLHNATGLIKNEVDVQAAIKKYGRLAASLPADVLRKVKP